MGKCLIQVKAHILLTSHIFLHLKFVIISVLDYFKTVEFPNIVLITTYFPLIMKQGYSSN